MLVRTVILLGNKTVVRALEMEGEMEQDGEEDLDMQVVEVGAEDVVEKDAVEEDAVMKDVVEDAVEDFILVTLLKYQYKMTSCKLKKYRLEMAPLLALILQCKDARMGLWIEYMKL